MFNSPIITKFIEFVKKHEVAIILVVAMILFSLLSFALGYLTAREQLKEPIQLQEIQEYERNQ